jgi:hypothetical protein
MYQVINNTLEVDTLESSGQIYLLKDEVSLY